jgi:CRISPR-associated protein Csx14
MAEATIPVDPTNPGQVFACLGLMEAAEVICSPVTGGFDLTEGRETFALTSDGKEDPILAVLEFLTRSEVCAATPDGQDASFGKSMTFKASAVYAPGAYPYPDPGARDRLPCVLVYGERRLVVDHWADGARDDAMKFWAGAGGYPGVALARDALDLLPDDPATLRPDPFAFSAPQSSSFRFDWRRDYVPLDAGFSPNRHGAVTMVGYPVVELLAAIGLRHARPHRETRLSYRYAAWGMPLPLPLARSALGCTDPIFPGLPLRRFHMTLGWPGQEGQAKCIIRVDEETPT